MAFVVGAVLALAVGLMATVVGLDRERGFYTTLMIVIAALYSLFAVLGGSTHALLLEALVGLAFVVVAVIGFRSTLWFVAAALAAHGGFDLIHGGIIPNPGVPPYWPAFCGAYDIVAAGYLAWLIFSGRTPATAPRARTD